MRPSVLAPPAHATGRFAIRFGPAASVSVGLRVLGGQMEENLFPGAELHGASDRFTLYRSGAWLLGHVSEPLAGNLERTTRRVYDELLGAASDHHLCRIWNYVPAINVAGADGLENYRAFSRGRSLAFEAAGGAEFKRWLPAASAVGSTDDHLTVVFAAHTNPPVHRENPQQIPAYDYPPEHGPRPPSFARASIVPRGDGRRDVFLSGTSAIKGHATVAPGDTLAQTRCTLENLRALGQACGIGASLGAGYAESRHVKIYLRHAHDHALVASELADTLLQPGDAASYLVADICRSALNVEIEMTLLGVG